MANEEQTSPDHEALLDRLVACARANDLDGMRAVVAAGFDLNSIVHGDDHTPLEAVILAMGVSPEVRRYDMVCELLRLGADPRRYGPQGCGALFAAALNMDTQMVCILLDAGADPNEPLDSDDESLYDWAGFHYRLEIWNCHYPETPTDAERADEESWLHFLDGLAVKLGRRRPDFLWLLRERGALTMAELRQRAGHDTLPARDDCNRFELRLGDPATQAGVAGDSAEAITLNPHIWIDGAHLDEPHQIDLPALVQSLHVEGWHEIFTCGCGVAGCAGIPEGIYVLHADKRIHWSLRRPQSAGNLMDPALSSWEATAKQVEFCFERTQMIDAVNRFLSSVRELVRTHGHRFEWPVHGLDVDAVMAIDPRRPYYEVQAQDSVPDLKQS